MSATDIPSTRHQSGNNGHGPERLPVDGANGIYRNPVRDALAGVINPAGERAVSDAPRPEKAVDRPESPRSTDPSKKVRKRKGYDALSGSRTRFFAMARQESTLWRRAWPALSRNLGEGRLEEFPGLPEWYEHFRKNALKQRRDTALSHERFQAAGISIHLIACGLLPAVTWDLAAYLFLTLAGFLVYGVLALLNGVVYAVLGRRFLATVGIFICSVSIGCGYFAIAERGRHVNDVVFHAAQLNFLDLVAFLPVVGGAMGLLDILLSRTFDGLATARYKAILMSAPSVGAISHLLDVVDDAGSPSGFAHYPDRRRMIEYIEVAAWLVKVGIPRAIRLPDPLLQVVFEERCLVASENIRALSLWVALPGSRTHQDLQKACCDIIFVLISGQYDLLPTVQMQKPSRKQRARAVWSFFRTLISGALPSAALLLIRRLGVGLPGPIGAGAVIFCAGWLVVTYLQLIDPLLSQKLTTIRDFLTTLKAGNGTADSTAK